MNGCKCAREGAWARGLWQTHRPPTMVRYVQLQVRGRPRARGPGSALGLSETTKEMVFRFWKTKELRRWTCGRPKQRAE